MTIKDYGVTLRNMETVYKYRDLVIYLSDLKEERKKGHTYKDIAVKNYGISRTHLWRIVKKMKWEVK